MSSDWIPLRWPCGPIDEERFTDKPSVKGALDAWLDPKALAFLKDGPINAIVVSWASGKPEDAAQQKSLQPLIAAAKQQGIAVIGRIDGQAQDAVQTAKSVGLAAVIADPSTVVPSGLQLIPVVTPAQSEKAGTSPIFALTKVNWPRIPTQWRSQTGQRSGGGGEAGPTGNPWVDSNGWAIQLSRALAPEGVRWLLSEPPEDVVGYRGSSFALAVADAAAYGGRWVVAFDAETRKALASGGAADTWTATCDAIKFFEQHKAWRQEEVSAKLAIVSDFAGPIEYLANESLNLMARRQLLYRVIARKRLNEKALSGIKGVLWVDQKPPEGDTKDKLLAFANAGGLLIVPATASALVPGPATGNFEGRYDLRVTGSGQVATALKPWSDPWLLAADTHLLLSRKYDVIRTFNAGSCNVFYTSGKNRGVAHIISYTARPIGYPVSLYVAHRYKTARFSTLNGVNGEPLKLESKNEGVEVYLPQFAPYAAVEFGV